MTTKSIEEKLFDLALTALRDPTQEEVYDQLPYLVQQYFDESQKKRRKLLVSRNDGFVVPDGCLTIVEDYGLFKDSWEIRYMSYSKGNMILRTAVDPIGSVDQFDCASRDGRNPLSPTIRFHRKFLFGTEMSSYLFPNNDD